MVELLRSELYKLRKDPSFHILCVVMITAPFALALITYISNQNSGSPAASGIKSFVNGVQGNLFFLKISLGILSGFFISGEYSSGVMKLTGSSGFSRGRIYLAKLAAFTLGIAFLSLLCPMICTLVGTMLSGFGSLPEVAAAEYIIRTMSLTILFAAAFASIVALLAITSTESGITVGVALLFFLFFDTISEFVGSYIPLYQSIYDYSVFKLFIRSAEFNMAGQDLFLSILISVITFAAFASLGMYAFQKKEIK